MLKNERPMGYTSKIVIKVAIYRRPLKRSVDLHLDDAPLPTDAVCHVWMNWSRGSKNRRFFKLLSMHVYSPFHHYFPLETGKTLNLQKKKN